MKDKCSTSRSTQVFKMLKKECSIRKEDEDTSDYYDWLRTPKKAPDDKKAGVTFRGSDDEYFKAHKMIMVMTHKKGNRFVINGMEMSIADAQRISQ